jgi:hypothetical protein
MLASRCIEAFVRSTQEELAMTWIVLSMILAAGLSVNLGDHDC